MCAGGVYFRRPKVNVIRNGPFYVCFFYLTKYQPNTSHTVATIAIRVLLLLVVVVLLVVIVLFIGLLLLHADDDCV
jgi:hypothetical protein